MFVPRALRLKGVKENQRRKPTQPVESTGSETASEDALVNAMQNATTDLAAPSPAVLSEDHMEGVKVSKKPKQDATKASPEYLAQLVAGVELIFTDHAHQDRDGSKWLEERYRAVDGGEKYIHLTAILEHANISTLKPQATRSHLRQAIQDSSSPTLELCSSGYYVRRQPSTYPAPFVPSNSFAVVGDSGVNFWDQRTIYVEPHIRHLCKTPAKVAHWLKEHGKLRAKWLPVQAVHTLYNSCAFVVLSGSVMHEDQWAKWRAAEKPEDWKIMTKVENLKRTEEYEKLVKESRAGAGKQLNDCMEEDGQNLLQDTSSTGAAGDGEEQAADSKRKTKKRKRKSTAGAADGEADIGAGEVAQGVDADRNIKRRA